MISRGTRGGGRGGRNLALVQLQSCIHASWISLFPPAWEQPTQISAVVISALSCAMLCSYPGSFPSQTARTPPSSPSA